MVLDVIKESLVMYVSFNKILMLAVLVQLCSVCQTSIGEGQMADIDTKLFKHAFH